MPFINDFDPYAGDFTKPNKGLSSVKPSELGRSNTVNTNALSDFQFSSKKPIKGVQRSNTIGAHAGPHAGASLSDITQICSWNRALLPRDFTNSLVHDAIKEHARTTPAAEAICSWDGSYNFQELNELSTQVGAFLVSKGVGPETFVPLLFEKSAWFVIAAVGVMKAGGAYVPLDINHPKERLEQIVQEVGAKIMLASSAGAKLGVEVDEIFELSPSSYSWLPEADEVISSVQPHNAVYVIFTSGSTGKPKGVVIEHRQFYSSAVARQKLTRSDSTCRVLQFASYSFDISVIDILPTLMFGGTVCILSEYERSADAIGAIHRLRANEIHITPSVINTMGPHLLPKMKTIGCGGECMLQTTIDMWAEETYLINGYGPTEACVITVCILCIKPCPF
jgi:non-ribosomal peptide synthetase component F